jgi:TolB-like protein
MVKRAITLGGGDPASASFHRCAAIRESQRRYRANYFVEGVTGPSRISDLFAVGRHTAFTHKSDAFDLKKIKRELNVPCVLERSVQRNGRRLRVSVPFVDAESGRHLSKI